MQIVRVGKEKRHEQRPYQYSGRIQKCSNLSRCSHSPIASSNGLVLMPSLLFNDLQSQTCSELLAHGIPIHFGSPIGSHSLPGKGSMATFPMIHLQWTLMACSHLGPPSCVNVCSLMIYQWLDSPPSKQDDCRAATWSEYLQHQNRSKLNRPWYYLHAPYVDLYS